MKMISLSILLLVQQCVYGTIEFDNMESGLVGYNLLLGDPLKTTADPGMKNQIFEKTGVDGKETLTTYSLNNCFQTMSVKSYTTTHALYKALESQSKSGNDLQMGYETDVAAGIPGLSVSSTIPPAFTHAWLESETMKGAGASFSHDHSMMSLSWGVCLLYEMRFSSYDVNAFTYTFTLALGELHDASSQSSTSQKAAFEKFIGDYGTHYMSESQLGAFFAQKTTYSGTVRKQVSFDALQACSAKKAADIFGISMGSDEADCSAEAQAQIDSFSQDDVQQTTITKGSRPTDIYDWAKQDFTPTPLKYYFSPIVNLFQDNFIEYRNIKNINNEAVNSTAIRMWFIPLYDDYCHTAGLECKNPSGCGYDDTCPISSICESGSVYECQSWTNWACWSCGGTPRERRKRYCDGCSDGEEFRVPSDTSRCCDVKHKVSVRVSCTDNDDPGDTFEVYGSISISIGSRTANQKKKVFTIARENERAMKKGSWWYGDTYEIYFDEGFDFLTNKGLNTFKLHEYMKESDKGSGDGDDMLGNFNGFERDPIDYTDYVWDSFRGEFYPQYQAYCQTKIKFYKV